MTPDLANIANRSGGVDIKAVGAAHVGGDVVGRDKIVTIYQSVAVQRVDEEMLAAARATFARLPVDGLPEAAALPLGSRMPFARNPLFVGRKENLQELAQIIKGGSTAAIGQIAAATGLGGIGKTQLAVEFAQRYGQFFAGGVFWLSFASAEGVPTEVAHCGGAGGLNLRADYVTLKIDEQVGLVLAAWQSPLPRLLIFDNCEDEGLLMRWRPPSGGCCVLVTSRRDRWDAT